MTQIKTTRLSPWQIFSRTALWNIGITALAFSIITILLSRTIADPDLWGHLRFGLDTLQAVKIIQVDPYSYLTAGQRWINHEWLAEVLFALAWTAGGAPGLILLKITTGVLTIAILYLYLLTLRLSRLQATILILILGVPLLSFFNSVRPQIFTYLCFALALLIIRQAETGKYRWLWAAPPLMVLWTNLHGGFLSGLGLLCCWAVLHMLAHKRGWLQIIPPTLASIAAILVNPYGMDLLIFLLRTVTVPRPDITEWEPLKLVSLYGLLYLLVLGMSVYWLVRSSEPCRPILLILFGITVLLPWTAVRHLPLFYIATLVLISEHAGSAWNGTRPQSQGVRHYPIWISSLFVALAVVLLIVESARNPFRIRLIEEEHMPVNAVALLKQSAASGNLATEYDWGEYVIWNLGPQIKVSMDGRRETIYSTVISEQNFNFRYGINDWDALLRQQRTDLGLVRTYAPDYNLLKRSPDWLLVYEDASSTLFVNQDSSLVGPLRHAVANFVPPPENIYFP